MGVTVTGGGLPPATPMADGESGTPTVSRIGTVSQALKPDGTGVLDRATLAKLFDLDTGGGTETVVGVTPRVANAGGSTGLGLIDNAPFADGSSAVLPAGFIYDETAGTALDENDVGAGRIDAKHAIVVAIEDRTTRGVTRRAIVSTGGGLAVDPTGLGYTLTPYAVRITTNTTTTPVASTAYISSIVICVEGVGTTSTITIRDKQGTPFVLVDLLPTTAVATLPTVLNFQTPIKMTSGIDVLTAAIAGQATISLWINYYQ